MLMFFSILQLLLALTVSPLCQAAPSHEFNCSDLGQKRLRCTITIASDASNAIYADTVSFSVDNPEVTISKWKASYEPESSYDSHFKKNKALFAKPVTLELIAQSEKEDASPASLYLTYLSKQGHTYHQQLFSLPFEQSKAEPATQTTPDKDTPEQTTKANNSAASDSLQQKIMNIFDATESWILRLLLAVLLGLLLSLTPCIYPMIPITIGILQSQGSSSLMRNFFTACVYVFGIATTFAALGTLAAFSGKMFGSFMNNPLVIVGIIAMLVYFAGSMIGLYDMYVPSFMQGNNSTVANGSLISVFLFGAATGTVASPCLSPGLVLLLSMVTALANPWIGFVLLFFFGIGLGIPLIAIGTFSSSLSGLPKAGKWMVDVKQFFGFLMLATCLYFLGALVPAYIVGWLSALYAFCLGIFYLWSANRATSLSERVTKNVVGMLLVALTVYLSFQAYKLTDMHMSGTPTQSFWMYNYQEAVSLAKADHKKMLIDVGAPYCSICKAIDRKIFASAKVQEKLGEYVAVKIEDIEANEQTQKLQKKFAIVGAPTIVVYDPVAKKELERWGGELYELSPEEFVERLS